MQTRTVGYVRIATTDSDEARRLLQSCEGVLRDYARRRGWDVIEIYNDTAPQRVGFRKMLETAHQADVVLIHEQGAQVSGYSLSREVQDMGMTCLDLNTQLDRKKAFVERLSKGRKRGARAGRHTAGKIPYGYIKADEGHGLQIEVTEAEVVRLIFREYLHLRSTSRVAELLTERGFKTRRGKGFSRASISWMLKNETYIGRVRYGDIRARGQHPPIISPIVFNKVQKVLQGNRKSGKMAALRRSSATLPCVGPDEPVLG